VLVQVPDNLVETTRELVINTMQAQPSGFSIPIKVDVGWGKTWADCK